ncbi:MAG: hypothetical protein P8130_14640 [Deltaproteobacteria bacterium]
MKTKKGILFFMKQSVLLLGAFIVGISFVACGGGSKNMKAEEPAAAAPAAEVKGSLSQSFTIVDQQGRKSGTLVIDPFGGALLLDENGKVLGKFKSETPNVQAMDATSEEQPEPTDNK